jgi:hypothetical protein
MTMIASYLGVYAPAMVSRRIIDYWFGRVSDRTDDQADCWRVNASRTRKHSADFNSADFQDANLRCMCQRLARRRHGSPRMLCLSVPRNGLNTDVGVAA